MVPEILIVGDPSRRRDLIDKVRACHYDVTLCAARELNRRVRTGPTPGAIVLAIGDVDATLLLAGLRRSRQGAAIPVVLFGRLGGEIRDLPDVLDLGADHFLDESVPQDELHDVLLELVGPSSGRTETHIDPASQAAPPLEPADRRGSSRSTRSLGMVTERLDTGGGTRPRAAARVPDSEPTGTDPVLGQLHRTLDRLEARLRDRSDDADHADADVAADIDLTRMGLDAIPDVESDDPHDSSDSGPGLRFGDDGGDRLADETDRGADEGFEGEPRSPDPARRARSPGEGRTRGGDERSAVLRGRRPERARTPRPTGGRERPPRLTVARTGTLEELEVPRLLWRLHHDRFSGRLTLQQGRAQKQVWLADGEVVFVRSNLSTDRFVDGLLRRGALTRPQYETARRLAAKQPGRAGRLLVEAGFVKPREMHRLLQDHLGRVLDSTFAWREGSWQLEPGDTTDERVRIEAPMPVMVLEGIRFRLEVDELRERLGTRTAWPRLVGLEGSAEDRRQQLSDSLRLLPEEERWLGRFDGKQTLETVLDEAGADEHAVLALIYALHVLGHLELIGEREPEAGGTDVVQVDVERLSERVRLARDADYFELLGLPRDASRADVRRACAELAATFADENLEPATRGQFTRELAELRAALDEARDVLTDDATRSAYLAHLGEP